MAPSLIGFDFEPGVNKNGRLWGISPEGIGTIGMLINFAFSVGVSAVTAPPPAEVQAMVEEIRVPRSGKA